MILVAKMQRGRCNGDRAGTARPGLPYPALINAHLHTVIIYSGNKLDIDPVWEKIRVIARCDGEIVVIEIGIGDTYHVRIANIDGHAVKVLTKQVTTDLPRTVALPIHTVTVPS